MQLQAGHKLDKDNAFVLPHLRQRMEEAVHDAIVYFKKQCPYCDCELFAGNVRNRFQVDHYVSIHNGGQDVPWNILPCCRRCNSKKRMTPPEMFLSEEKRTRCEGYLKAVRDKHIGQLQDSLEKYERVKVYLHSVLDEANRLSSSQAAEVVDNLAALMGFGVPRHFVKARENSNEMRLWNLIEMVMMKAAKEMASGDDHRIMFVSAEGRLAAWHNPNGAPLWRWRGSASELEADLVNGRKSLSTDGVFKLNNSVWLGRLLTKLESVLKGPIIRQERIGRNRDRCWILRSGSDAPE